MSIGVRSATTWLSFAHSPMTASPASVNPMKLEPPSPRKINAPRPGRKL